MKHYNVEIIEKAKTQKKVISLFENNIDKIFNFENDLILIYKNVYFCIHKLDNSNIFFKIKRKKMEITISEGIKYDTSIDFDNQPEEIKLIVLGLHSLAEKQNPIYNEHEQLISEVSNHDTFSISIEYLHLTESSENRDKIPEKIIKIKEI